ncbi:hypothetical protein OCK74_09690 [Chitinophagaceae bacterium LB-8]|uniref:Uncharacterized protein n=1 Tax=Paraflavisolibacter caeni TaxID=2982496 RepID=A0A9X2XUN1_9BACT|nr:hypothetical protein [Paraflavisolibacter caeni]MCU7549386.1 hypothetical protein [Paraflavisolibacter caeni]
MDTTILFEEVQGPVPKSVRDFFRVTTGIFFVCAIINFFWQKGSINELTIGLFAGLLLFALASIFLERKLVTQIRSDGIYVRYPPFLPLTKYKWDSVQHLHIRKYDVISEYGSYGIRYSTIGSGTAYTVSGDIGIQIVFKNGAKLLIGTQRPDEVTNVLKELEK